ncbi:MAG: glycosyltransferase family 4 protein [Balneolaceae bacterium]|nr:glycosyltransferase family 4 protein [Balneolaceae bacterium]
MKIGFNLTNYNSDKITGTGYFSKRLLLELLDRNIPGLTVYIFLQNHIHPSVFGVYELSDSVIVKRTPRFKFRALRVFYEQLILPFRICNLDIIFSPSVGGPAFCKPSRIIAIHDMIPFIFKKKYGLIQNNYIKLMIRLLGKRAHQIITVSENSKNDIVRFTSVSENKITIIYNFINNLAEENEKKRENYFLSVSTLQPGKNLIALFESFDMFIRKTGRKDFKLYVIGSKGWNTKKIFQIKDTLKFSGNIIIKGYLSESELELFYRNCTALICLSHYEGFGLPPLEAMYYSKPSIVSNNSSFPEVVNGAGILVNPNDKENIFQAMVSILDSEIRRKLQKQIPKQIKKFNPKKETDKFIYLINSLVKKD